ncbi:MAG: PD-(D/E)XK nuclease family protein [Legionella sp.]|nr:MAG: PD-(D/E)XK nuclease family protein [Legionella sp.]
MHALINKTQVFQELAQGATVVTPNNRLSASLLQQYYQQRSETTVDKPHCLPYRTAIIQAYQQLLFQQPQANHPTLINEALCQQLWRKTLLAETVFTFSEGLLHAVIEAWQHCQQWQISPQDSLFYYTPQTRQFQSWWQKIDQQLAQLQLLSEYQLLPYLLSQNLPLFPQGLIWTCFDEFNPQQLALQNHLEQLGIKQSIYELNSVSASPKVLAAADPQEENQQLFAWLKTKLAEGEERIAVVVPDLQNQSRTLHRNLLQHFDPNLFNISLGQALSDFPLVAHALLFLQLESHSIKPHQASLLLQSPYLGEAKEEFLARSQFLQDSSLLQEKNLNLKSLIQEMHPFTSKLAERLTKISAYPKSASPEEWVALLQERLQILGFPGDYGLNSENYQCLNRFASLFDELREFTLISPQLDREECLQIFQRLAQHTIFQAQKTQAKIQISGLLEASGCEFSNLWITGLTDQCLPQKTRLSAFIPRELQIKLHMPHSLPERELLFAQQTLERLRNGSPEVVFSFAKLIGETPNLPCALIKEFPPFTRLPGTTLSHAVSLIPYEESYSLPLNTNEAIAGGTALLANQAKCPFKAFAEHRLRAKASLDSVDGLDHRERGQIIHRVMELLWQNLGNQEHLKQLSQAELDERIKQAIQTALLPIQQLHLESFPELVQRIELTRLHRLVQQCLEWEKQRPPFSVNALEQSYTLQLADLEFKVRVDRLDQVGEKKWVIDYKSSLPSSRPWNEDRPKEPQLLLYALLDEEINALLFMQVKAGKVACSGISETSTEVSGIGTVKKEETWALQRQRWQEQLTLLAEEFKTGHCPPQPSSANQCQLCDFQNLCRFQANE